MRKTPFKLWLDRSTAGCPELHHRYQRDLERFLKNAFEAGRKTGREEATELLTRGAWLQKLIDAKTAAE